MLSDSDPAADRPKDAAIAGPVRAATNQICFVAVRSVVVAAVMAATAFAWTAITDAASPGAKPGIAAITRAVEAWFELQPDYQAGDLITRSQVETVLDKLAAAGVTVPNAEAISARGLANDSFLVRELTNKTGRPFMRRVARTPGAFAQLDRLSTIPRGERLIHDLIRGKGGDKLIEYLATTTGGHRMGTMMAAVPGGTDLNKPTDRIYTLADFEAALQETLENSSP